MADLTGAFNGNAFDPSQVDEPQGFEPLPTDVEFHWEIGDAELKPTKNNDGTILKLRCNVLGPSHAGRVVFANLNIQNPSQQAEQIAQQQLGAVCRALGITALADSDELLGGQFMARCRTKAANGQYAAQSEIDYGTVKPLGGSAPAKPAAKPAAQAKPAPAAKVQPWAKRQPA
jgi:hypothetical protein